MLAERLDGAALEAAVGDVDVVLDGTDNFATRFAVNRACVARGVPLVSGAAVRVEGQIAVFPNAATARATRVSTTTRTNGSAIARATACWRPCPASSAR